jgi:hypothetical protein
MDPQITYTQYQKDMNELKWENRVQTIALILVFLWGINTFSDLVKKI